ncbi:DUF5947 family protein [Streptantibioticus ferralitis]|uniref:DUF5947 family protein n=1 Tax=Streptantibioticus ferralitis TaxID=236510 RepID=A0ABT5YTP2_9ACTN|nr:DUF5947 family protein [Streptantibioticus ferralitis]MDF2254977.1 DUF5947 family protein [Streptantibioticus ferralitis]
MTAQQQTAAPPRAGLRRFLAPTPPAPQQCELCGRQLPDGHRHLADTEQRALACACDMCAVLFTRPGAGGGRFHTVPDRYLADPGPGLDEATWQRLRIPVSVVFFFHNAALDRPVALYPSPAGATESELDPESWQTVVAATPLAELLAPDVEALLVRRSAGRGECFLVPIDDCYQLVGRMRLHWQGFDGGSAARADLDAFFGQVAARARLPRKDEQR